MRQPIEDFELAPQNDAAVVIAMAEMALEDAGLVGGAQLTEREARALFAHTDRTVN